MPSFFRGSWENAIKILELNGTLRHNEIKDLSTVISLTSGDLHYVRTNGNHYKCFNCPQFEKYNLCAHIIATAYDRKELEKMLAFVELPLEKLSGVTSSLTTIQPGKKQNEKNKRRKRPFPRNVANYSDPFLEDSVEDEQDHVSEKFEVVFVQSTKSTTCYGCSGKWRASSNSFPPPPPYDIILKRKERRCFKKRGTNKIQISSAPEFVYYHCLESCLKQKHDSGRNGKVVVKTSTKVQLSDRHQHLLASQFGEIKEVC